MYQWIYDNLFVFILAGLAGFDLAWRYAGRLYSTLLRLPPKEDSRYYGGLE